LIGLFFVEGWKLRCFVEPASVRKRDTLSGWVVSAFASARGAALKKTIFRRQHLHVAAT